MKLQKTLREIPALTKVMPDLMKAISSQNVYEQIASGCRNKGISDSDFSKMTLLLEEIPMKVYKKESGSSS